MQLGSLDDRLPLVQRADLRGKVVLVRFDHNVVKKGVITDPFRIDRTIGTLFYIVAQGGRPIMMTHVGRPRDKKTGAIEVGPASGVEPIVAYLESKLHSSRIVVPSFPAGEGGIAAIDTSINLAHPRPSGRGDRRHLPAQHPLVRRRGGGGGGPRGVRRAAGRPGRHLRQRRLRLLAAPRQHL